MILKKNSLLFLMINTGIFLSSCASLNQNCSKEALIKAIKTKVNNRNYIIDLPTTYKTEYAYIHIPGYIQIHGDTLISFTEYDNPDGLNYFRKNYVEQMQSKKYKILDYKQTESGRSRVIISFWFKMEYQGDDIRTQVSFKDNLIPIHYKLEFSNSTKVRVYMNDYFIFGILRL